MQLEGSCHCRKVTFSVDAAEPVPFMRCYCSICRKTAGAGGYAINLGAATHSMKVTGKRYLGIYQARIEDGSAAGAHTSEARRYFCSRCGSALWVWDPRWPELVHPHAGAIDTPLPAAPGSVHIMLGSKAAWVPVEGRPQDARFDAYPDQSLAQWHEAHGLRSPPANRSNHPKMQEHRIFSTPFAKVYPLYVQKAERKSRTKQEVDQVICWLTGYDEAGLRQQVESGSDFRTFFARAPALHPNCALITGVVCGVRVEEVADPLMRNIRYLDKLVDELAKGRKMDKILR